MQAGAEGGAASTGEVREAGAQILLGRLRKVAQSNTKRPPRVANYENPHAMPWEDEERSGMTPLPRRKRGAALFLALVLFLMLTAVSLAILLLVNNHYILANELLVRHQSYYVAEAGLLRAFVQLRNGNTGSFDITEGGLTANVNISGGAGGSWTISSTVTYQTIENL